MHDAGIMAFKNVIDNTQHSVCTVCDLVLGKFEILYNSQILFLTIIINFSRMTRDAQKARPANALSKRTKLKLCKKQELNNHAYEDKICIQTTDKTVYNNTLVVEI